MAGDGNHGAVAVVERCAADLLAARPTGIGYLLKVRVADVDIFLEALRRVAAGGLPSIRRS